MRVTWCVRSAFRISVSLRSPFKTGVADSANKPTIAERMATIKHKVLVMSGKGGVGKSTVSAVLARALSASRNVAVLDIDICGPSQPRMMGAEQGQVTNGPNGWQLINIDQNLSVMSIGFLLGNNQEAVVWRGPRKHGMIKQFLRDVDWGNLDYLIIDTPPGTSDEHISITETLTNVSNVDGALLVTTPQEVSLMDVRKEVGFCKITKLPVIGIVENMSSFVCPCCNEQTVIFPPTTGGAKTMCEQLNLDLLAQLPLDPRLAKCSDDGTDFMKEHQNSPAAIQYKQLADILIAICER